MNDYLWFLIIVIGIPCICYTIYSIVNRYCEYKEHQLDLWGGDDNSEK